MQLQCCCTESKTCTLTIATTINNDCINHCNITNAIAMLLNGSENIYINHSNNDQQRLNRSLQYIQRNCNADKWNQKHLY